MAVPVEVEGRCCRYVRRRRSRLPIDVDPATEMDVLEPCSPHLWRRPPAPAPVHVTKVADLIASQEKLGVHRRPLERCAAWARPSRSSGQTAQRWGYGGPSSIDR